MTTAPLVLSNPPSPCTPPFWARGGHLQTILGHLLPSRCPRLDSGGDARAHRIPVSGGDELVAFWTEGSSDVVVYLFHGLGGDVNSDYMRSAARVAQVRSHSVLAVNHRGCGAGKGLAAGPYHSGSADDVARVLAYGRALRPRKRHIAIGFSLSGNALLLLLGTRMAPAPDAAIAVNPPIDLERSSRLISSGLNRLYDLRFVHLCRRAIRERFEAGLLERPYVIPRFGRLWDVDEIYTADAGGFENARDYYAKCSTKGLLASIEQPTVVLTAADDPFVDPRSFHEAARSPAVHLHVEASGGHVGYLARGAGVMGARRWLDEALGFYLDALVEVSRASHIQC